MEMASIDREEAAGSPDTREVPMGAKPMVATHTDGGDVNKLKEDAMAMVAATAASKKHSKEDHQSPASNINPPLLASARVGCWQALNALLEREGARKPPMVVPTQEFLELLATRRGALGRVAVSSSHDVEEGVDHQPASPEAGALLKGVTPDGDTALHAVAGNGDAQDFLKYAGILYDRDRGLLFAKNHEGDTPLHCAARAGNSKMVSYLIDLAGREGADTKLRLLRMENKRHETVLHEAVRIAEGRILGHKESGALLDAAADPAGEEENRRDDHETGDVPSEDGKNKDLADGAPGKRNVVELLMDADPELANYPTVGISPLYLAILLGKSTIALTLYDKSAGNLSYSGADGQNALHAAVLRDRDTAMVEFLVHWNKSLTTQADKDGSTPLHFASSVYFWTGSYMHFELLCRPPWCRFVLFPWRSTHTLKKVFKANPTSLYQADKNGSFPIHVAASVGARNAIQFFHDECPDSAGLRDAKGRTFLHLAVEKGRLNIVSYVCRTPALAWILNMHDNGGNTALHLAIQARSFRMFCALLGNREVNFNLTNIHGETPRDLSRSLLPCGMSYRQNSENKIYDALWSVGANHGALRWDKTKETYGRLLKPKDKDKDKESNRLKDATQTLVVASVLIATVAFSATFALPGGYRADDHTNGGTPTLAGSYAFDAFMMATTLAFICSALATIGFAFAATPMVNLITRKLNFSLSLLFMVSSVTCLSIAFALGVYMVLAPVAHNTAVAVCVITPAVVLSANMEAIFKSVILARPLCIRKGLFPGMIQLLKLYLSKMATALWPFIATFGWAALARIHRRHH